MISSPTPPGFTVDSPNMSVMFISAHQVGMGSHTAEYVLGWKKVMEMITEVFEKETKIGRIVSDLSSVIQSWAEQGWMGRGKPIKINLKVSEEAFFPPPLGQMKQVKVQFFDELATSVKFFVRRKVKGDLSLTLKDIAMKNLSVLVDTAESVDSLELPRDLSKQLVDEIDSCWKHRYLTDLKKGGGQRRKSYSEDYNDNRHAWRARTFDENDQLKIAF